VSYRQVSIILEVLSFFCVTIDLYGAERIRSLRGRLQGLIDSVRFAVFADQHHPSDASVLLRAVLLFVGMAALSFWLTKSLSGNAWSIVPMVLFVVTLYILMFMVPALAMFVVFLLLVHTTDTVLGMAAHLLSERHLEGILVWVGASLFLASKALVFWAG